MSKVEYRLERNGPKRLRVEIVGIWEQLRILLDGQPFMVVEGRAALERGASATLPDGSTFLIRLEGFSRGLRVYRDGQPLPDSPGDPAQRLQTAMWLLAIEGGRNLLGAGALAIGAEPLQGERMLWFVGCLVLGLILSVGAYGAKRRSLTPVTIAFVLLALERVIAVVASFRTHESLWGFSSVFQFLVVFWVGQAVVAAWRIRREAAPAPFPAPTAAPDHASSELVPENPYAAPRH
jgi:hypothetical protein